MTEVVLREAVEGDAAALAAVYRDAYRENRDLGFPAKAESATAEQVGTWIRDHRVAVAAADGAMVGGVRAETTDPGRVKLSRLAVDPERQGEGIGHALVAHVEARADDRGHDVVRLTTPADHPYLPDFYRGRGYERTGSYPLEYRDYDEIVLEKHLE